MPSGRSPIWFATTNRHKFSEAKSALAKLGLRVRQLGTLKVEIQDEKLERIALFAAKSLRTVADRVIVVEDSGLFISDLNGFPGPYSSYVYRTIGTKGIIRLLKGNRNRKACFQSVVAARLPGGALKMFKGRIEGSISEHPAGNLGFDFDPIFIPHGMRSTFGQLEQESKNQKSHRGRAFRRFAEWYVRRPISTKLRQAEP